MIEVRLIKNTQNFLNGVRAAVHSGFKRTDNQPAERRDYGNRLADRTQSITKLCFRYIINNINN
jgi:hypothetical protein